jgi:hypothetical protein
MKLYGYCRQVAETIVTWQVVGMALAPFVKAMLQMAH